MKYQGSLITLLLLVCVIEVKGQALYELRGVVADSGGTALPGATIRVSLGRDSLSVISRKDGGFAISGIKDTSFTIHVSLIGYQSIGKTIMVGNQRTVTLDTIRLMKDFHPLDTVIVTSIAPIILKGDTVEYKAAAYKAQKGDLVEDLIRKFPGITVNREGQIIVQGKKVTKITVNGKDFFGDDILIATRNLPSDIVSTIDVIQDYGPESKLTGIECPEWMLISN